MIGSEASSRGDLSCSEQVPGECRVGAGGLGRTAPDEVPGTPYNLPIYPPDPISEVVRLADADIAVFEARLREVAPAYQRGDSMAKCSRCQANQREGMPGYWRSSSCRWDLEFLLRPVVL